MPTTTSSPLASAASYLKLHIPSFSAFQYAPAAECMPRRPSLAPASEGACCIIVLLTANLNCGWVVDVEVSDIRDCRIVFMMAVFHDSVEVCS